MRARELVAVALLVSACAAQDVGDVAVAPAPLDAPAPVPAEPPELEREDNEELGLAEYERLLADKETRLRAAGVLLAARTRGTEEMHDADSRFSRSPPAPAPIAGVSGDENLATATPAKSKRPAAKGGGSATSAAEAGPPAPPPADPSPPREKSEAKNQGKKVKYQTTTQPEARGTVAGASPVEPEAPGGRCQNICDLSAATCDLEGKICDLATRHPDDPRYGDLCRRADDDCRQAAEACQRCSP